MSHVTQPDPQGDRETPRETERHPGRQRDTQGDRKTPREIERHQGDREAIRDFSILFIWGAISPGHGNFSF